jgi:glycine hydroxymethyltransferase
MVDMAHFAGLVAGKVFTDEFDPVKWADVVTSTTHKTLRGPRGAIILCKKEFADYVNKGCPMVLGGPLNHIVAAKAVAFREASSENYRTYAQNVVKNAKALAESCIKKGMKLQTGGTDNHLMLVDVTTYGLTGKQAEAALFKCGVTANANALPYDKNGAWWTSGIRIGTPGLTTLGMNESDMGEVSEIIDMVLKGTKPGLTKDGKPAKGKILLDESVQKIAEEKVQSLLSRHVLYPELDLQFLKKEFVTE